MVRRRAGLVFVAAVLLFGAIGCTSTHRRSAAPPGTAISFQPAAPGAPILRLSSGCSGGCVAGIAGRLDFVELVLYADGRALVGSPGESSWWMTDGMLSADELTRARALAGQVLASDTIRLPPNMGVADGPAERLTGWSNGKELHTDTAVRLDPDLSTRSPDRSRINAINTFVALVSGAVTARGHTYSPTSLALFTEPTRPGDVMPPWPGPPLDGFGGPIDSPPTGVRCGLLHDLPSTLLPNLLGTDRGRVWSTSHGPYEVLVRALLPHETTCQQAFSV